LKGNNIYSIPYEDILRDCVDCHIIPQFFFIDVSVYSVSNAKSERSCTRVLGASISPCFYDFSIRIRNCSDIMFFFSMKIFYAIVLIVFRCRFDLTFYFNIVIRSLIIILNCTTWLPLPCTFFTNKLHAVLVPSVVQITRGYVHMC
jgi:hypothetical protein